MLAIMRSNARMLYVKKKQGVSMQILANNFVNTISDIENFFEKHKAPCAASLTRPQTVEEVWEKKSGHVYLRRLKLPKHLSQLV